MNRPDPTALFLFHFFDFAAPFHTSSALKLFFSLFERNLSTLSYFGEHLGDFFL